MKIFNKILFLVILSLITSSCTMAVTHKLWESPIIGAQVESFFVDKEGSKVVLVGRKNPETNLGMHYSITDKSDLILKIFE